MFEQVKNWWGPQSALDPFPAGHFYTWLYHLEAHWVPALLNNQITALMASQLGARIIR
jgi:hypothetical protein